jgi:hypothetical protein
MAGLNNLISNTAQQTTTLPTWFDTAQQNVVNQAGQAFNAAPAPQQTVAQNAVNALSGPTNAFTQAGSTLQSIAGGAANPWITNAQTGQVTPDTSTALGGLFQAQNQQLQQLMPSYTAAPSAAAIGTGNFGSLRGQTAVNKSMADAQANLFAQQNAAALQNQATGVNAASAAGNVAQQNINNLLTTGQYQQASPYTNVSNYGKVLGGIQAPTTVQNQTQLSPLNQYAGLYSLLAGSGTPGSTGLLGNLFGTSTSKGALSSIPGLSGLSKLFGTGGDSGLSQNLTPGSYTLADGGTMVINPDNTRTITDGAGNVSTYDSQGNATIEGANPTNPDGTIDYSGGGWGTGGDTTGGDVNYGIDDSVGP